MTVLNVEQYRALEKVPWVTVTMSLDPLGNHALLFDFHREL